MSRSERGHLPRTETVGACKASHCQGSAVPAGARVGGRFVRSESTQAGQRAIAAVIGIAERLDRDSPSLRRCSSAGDYAGRCLNSIARPVLNPSPPPTITNGMLFRVCELPLPSSLVQTIVVLSSSDPSPPGSGVSAKSLRPDKRLARSTTC